MRNILLGAALALMGVLLIGALVVAAGLYNVAADKERTDAVYAVIETARERSIAVRASDTELPDLADPRRVRRGAGNYDSMCVGCHLKPGAEET